MFTSHYFHLAKNFDLLSLHNAKVTTQFGVHYLYTIYTRKEPHFDKYANCFGRDMNLCRQIILAKTPRVLRQLVGFEKSFFLFPFFSCICWSHPGEEVLQRLRCEHSHFPPGQPVTAAAAHGGEETSTRCVRWGRGFPSEAPLLSSDAFKNRGLTNSWFHLGEHSVVYTFCSSTRWRPFFSWTWENLWRLKFQFKVKMSARHERPAALLVLLEDKYCNIDSLFFGVHLRVWTVFLKNRLWRHKNSV